MWVFYLTIIKCKVTFAINPNAKVMQCSGMKVLCCLPSPYTRSHFRFADKYTKLYTGPINMGSGSEIQSIQYRY